VAAICDDASSHPDALFLTGMFRAQAARTGRSSGSPSLPGRRGGIRQFLDIGTGIPTAGNTH
jgi:hypothetical protein